MPQDTPNPFAQEVNMSQIAREVARGIVPTSTILKNFNITAVQLEELSRHPIFTQRLKEELEIWSASNPQSIAERVRVKCAVMVEESLPEMFSMLHDSEASMMARIEAFKTMAKLAAMEGRGAGEVGTDNRVVINITMGDQKVSIDKEITPPSKTIEGEVVRLENAQ